MTDPSASSAARHEAAARASGASQAIRCAVLTVSDSRTIETDASGDELVQQLGDAGHEAVDRRLIPDDAARIAATIEAWTASGEVSVIITTGGTGIAVRDTTIEAVRKLLVAELEGFGELFRMLSYEQIGAAAMLSRAVAGLAAGHTFVFCLPGSTDAVRLAMTKLIVPQLPHLVWQRRG